MKFLRSTTVLMLALCMFSTAAIAAPEACTGISKKCTKDVLYDKDIGGTTYSCYDCEQVLCKDGGNGGLGATEKSSVCTEKTTSFTPISDDDSSYGAPFEAAPETDPVEKEGPVTVNQTGGVRTELVIIQEQDCSDSSVNLCRSNGASCGLVHDQGGKASEVCRWPAAGSAEDCKRTAGIWTAASSNYAKNHPDAVTSGGSGACITDVNNIRRKLNHATLSTATPVAKTDSKVPGLATPTRLRVREVTGSTLTLVWTDNSSTEFGVEVYRIDAVAARSGDGASWEFIGLAEERIDANVRGTGSRSYTDQDLAPGRDYCYRTRAYVGFDRVRTSGFSESVCGRTDPL